MNDVLWKRITLHQHGNVNQTIKHIPRIIAENYKQVDWLAKKLKGRNHEETCRNIWNWIRENVRYQNDQGGEELRRPQRTIAEGVGDCDCMSILSSSLMLNLGIANELNIVGYKKNTPEGYSHIYTSCNDEHGNRIVIDTVPEIPYFKYEAPNIVNHKIITMSIEELAGIGEIADTAADTADELNRDIDSAVLMGMDNDELSAIEQEEIFGNIEIVDPEIEGYDYQTTVGEMNDLLVKQHISKARRSMEDSIRMAAPITQDFDIHHELGVINKVLNDWDNSHERLNEAANNTRMFKQYYHAMLEAKKRGLHGADEIMYVKVDREGNVQDRIGRRINIFNKLKETVTKVNPFKPRAEGGGGSVVSTFINKFKKGGDGSGKGDTQPSPDGSESGAEQEQMPAAEGKKKNNLWNIIKKFDPAMATTRNTFLLALKANIGQLAVKWAIGFMSASEAAKLGYTDHAPFAASTKKAVAKWESLGGSADAFKKAVMKGASKKLGLSAAPVIPAAFATAAAIYAVMAPIAKDLKLLDKKGDEGSPEETTETTTDMEETKDKKNVQKAGDTADTPAGDKSVMDKVKDFFTEHKKPIIIVAIVITIGIIALIIWRVKKGKKKSASGRKAARTRRMNGLLSVRRPNPYRSVVNYSSKKPHKTKRLAGIGAVKKTGTNHLKALHARAKAIRSKHPRMKYTSALKQAAKH